MNRRKRRKLRGGESNSLRYLLFKCGATVLALPAAADDVGISEARLVEETNHVYVIEAEVPPVLVGAIRTPVLPANASALGVDRARVGPLVSIRYRFSTGDAPLSPDDELILPWARTGLFIAAHWQDGFVQRAFFGREADGIHVPVARLRPRSETMADVLFRHAAAGWSHVTTHWLHLALVLACALPGSPRLLFRLLVAFALGQGFSMIASDFGIPAVPAAVAEGSVGIAVILLARAVLSGNERMERYELVLLVLGLIHGLSYAGTLQAEAVSRDQFFPALFARNVAVDAAHLAAGIIVSACCVAVRRAWIGNRTRKFSGYGIGGLGVALTIGAIHGSLSMSEPAGGEAVFELPGGQQSGRGAAPPAPARLTHPVMGFLTLSPFEARLELLMEFQVLGKWFGIESGEPEPMTGESVNAITRSATALVSEHVSLQVDGARIPPAGRRADFVSVSNYGVLLVENPEEISTSNAVLGVTFAWPVERMPRDVELAWSLFGNGISEVPVAVTDPASSQAHALKPPNGSLQWKNRFSGLRRPEIREVPLSKPTLPLISAVLLCTGVILVLRNRHCGTLRKLPLAYSFIAAGLVCYPFARTPVHLPGLLGVPAHDRVTEALDQLLTNVYRSFDYRTEEAIYDQLAVSAAGEQLSSIYLEHRRALEMENRGGARASVDEVEVLEVANVAPSGNGGLSVQARWSVSGSVSHFGHTHYRRNLYNANLNIRPVKGAWKIFAIEILDEERVL